MLPAGFPGEANEGESRNLFDQGHKINKVGLYL